MTPQQTSAGQRGFPAVQAWLDARGVRYSVLEHEPTMTARAQAHATGVEEPAFAKTIALRDHDDYVMAVVPAGRLVDESRVRRLLGRSAHLRLATEDEMARDLDLFEVGALPPFGPMLPVPEVVDVRLLRHETVVCAGGDHRHSIVIEPRELLRIAEPRVADVCRQESSAHSRFHELPWP